MYSTEYNKWHVIGKANTWAFQSLHLIHRMKHVFRYSLLSMDKYSKVLIRWTIFSNAVPFAIRSRWTIMSIAICINNFNLVGQLSNNVMLLLRWTIVQQCYVTSCHLGGQLSTATFFLQYGLGGQLSIPTCINSCNLAGQLSNNVMLLLRWTFVQQMLCYFVSFGWTIVHCNFLFARRSSWTVVHCNVYDLSFSWTIGQQCYVTSCHRVDNCPLQLSFCIMVKLDNCPLQCILKH